MELLSTLNPKSNTSLVENLEDKGPKISKSLRSSDEKKEELSKGVRGRRKKLYSSPLKKTMGGAKSTPGSPKIIPMAVSSKNYNLTSAKSLPNVPKSISNCFVPFTLQREGTFTKTRTNFSEKSTASDTNSICKNSKPRSTLSKPAFQNKSVPVLKIAKSFSDASKVTRTVSEYGAKNIEKNIESDINKIKSIYPEKKTEGFVAFFKCLKNL